MPDDIGMEILLSMEYRRIKVTNEVGLHARPAALFVKESGLFKFEHHFDSMKVLAA